MWGERKDGAGEKQPHLLASLVKSMPSYIYIDIDIDIYTDTYTHIYSTDVYYIYV